MKTFLMVIGLFHAVFCLLGFLEVLHYRLYIGLQDVVMVPKSEYEDLKKLKEGYAVITQQEYDHMQAMKKARQETIEPWL